MKKYLSKMTALVLSALMLLNTAAPAFARQLAGGYPDADIMLDLQALPANYNGIDYTGIQLDYADYNANLVAEKSVPVKFVRYLKPDGTALNANKINESAFAVLENSKGEFRVESKYFTSNYELSYTENGADYYTPKKTAVWAKQIETKFTVTSKGKVIHGDAYDVLIWRGGDNYEVVGRERFPRIYEQYTHKIETSPLKPVDFIKEKPGSVPSIVSEVRGLIREFNKINRNMPARETVENGKKLHGDLQRMTNIQKWITELNNRMEGDIKSLFAELKKVNERLPSTKTLAGILEPFVDNKWDPELNRIREIEGIIEKYGKIPETEKLVRAEIKKLPRMTRAVLESKLEAKQTKGNFVFRKITAFRTELGKNNTVIQKIISKAKTLWNFGAEPKVKTAKPGSLLGILEKYVKNVEEIDAKSKAEVAKIAKNNPARTNQAKATVQEVETFAKENNKLPGNKGCGNGVKAGAVAMVGGMVVLITAFSIYQVYSAPSSYTDKDFAALNAIDLEAGIEKGTKENPVELPIALALGLINESNADRILSSLPNAEEVLEASEVVAAHLQFALENPEVLNEIKRGIRLESLSAVSNTDLSKYKNSANTVPYGNYTPGHQKRLEK